MRAKVYANCFQNLKYLPFVANQVVSLIFVHCQNNSKYIHNSLAHISVS